MLPGSRLLGLDLGSKTIGLALSDPALIVASPIDTFHRTKFGKDAAKLQWLIEDRSVGGIVLGLPINMDGSEGPRCQSTRQFAANLIQTGMDRPIAFWDERLSTVGAFNLTSQLDVNVNKREKKIDQNAAAFILQGAIDFLNN